MIFILLLDWGKPKILDKIYYWSHDKIPPIKIQNLEIIPRSRIDKFILVIFKILSTFLYVLIFYIYFSVISIMFPNAQKTNIKIFLYLKKSFLLILKHFLYYSPKMIFIILVIVLVRYLLRFTHFIFNEVKRGNVKIPGFHEDWVSPTDKIIRFFIVAFGIAIILPNLPGYDSPAFKGLSIFLGVLFSLGSTSAVSNIIAGVFLTYTTAFKVGDRIKIGDSQGDIIDRGFLVTRIRTVKNEEISIPNNVVLSAKIINYSAASRKEGLIIHTTITIGYDVPWDKVHKLLILAANDTKYISKEPSPFVLQSSLNNFSVSYQINAYTNKPKIMDKIYSELHQNIQDKFNKAGVEIMSPAYSALRDGNLTTIPKNFLPFDYKTPFFRIPNTED